MCKGKAGKVAEKKQGKQIQYLFISTPKHCDW